MRISGAANRGGELSGSRKAALEKQIRMLERKRDKILEKLGIKTSSEKRDAATISTGTLHINSTHSGGSGDGTESGVAAPQADIAAVGTQDIGKVLRELSANISFPQDDSELPEDPKELMKQLQLIEMQIMALRQQIGDDSSEALEVDLEQAARLAAAGMDAREADTAAESAAALPLAEVTAAGRVDGYA